MLITLYARKEPTTDRLVLEHMPPSQLQKECPKDVCIYRDKQARQFRARYPWSRSKPDRRNKYIMLNCYKYRIEWLEDLEITKC